MRRVNQDCREEGKSHARRIWRRTGRSALHGERPDVTLDELQMALNASLDRKSGNAQVEAASLAQQALFGADFFGVAPLQRRDHY